MQHDFILLDRSGSMEGKWSETLGAVNGYVKKLADDKVDTGVTLAVFDAQDRNLDYVVLRDRITPTTWKPVDSNEVSPRGYTPLNDAIGKLVKQAQAGFNGVQYEKVAILIVTDGHENHSKEVTHAQAKNLLNECRAKGWQVIFIGADFDNQAQATSYNNAAAATLSSIPVAAMAATMSYTAGKRGLYGATGQSINFSDEEKEELRKTS